MYLIREFIGKQDFFGKKQTFAAVQRIGKLGSKLTLAAISAKVRVADEAAIRLLTFKVRFLEVGPRC